MLLRRTVTAALVLVVASRAAVAQNQLLNPGFEAGTLAGWLAGGPGGGSVFAGPAGSPIPGADPAYGTAASLVLSGQFSASGVVSGNCCAPPSAFTLTQIVSLVPGELYNVGFSMVNAGSGSAFGMDTGDPFTQIFVDGVGLLPSLFYTVPPGNWFNFASSFTAASSSVTVTFQIIGSGTAFAPVSVDDFFVNAPTPNVVPEPATIALVAAGLVTIGLARRRRTA